MIKNIVFDFGQVLVRFEPEYMVGRYVTDPEDAALLTEVIFDRLYWDRLDDGTISDSEVMDGVRSRIPERLHAVAEEIYYNWIYNIPEIDGMRKLVIELRDRGFGLYLLSNICTYFADHQSEIPILKLLDGCVFSAVARQVKPEKAIYDHLTEKFGLKSEETLFIDDRQTNVDGAHAAGWKGILFDGDADRLRSKLKAVLD